MKNINLNFSIPFLSGVKINDKILLAKNLATMIEAGLPLTRALSVIERQARNKKFKETVQGLSDDVNRGEALSVAMEKRPKVFSRLFISMVKAGEESGSLAKSLRSVGEQLEKTHQLAKKIRGAMLYPAIILTVMIAIGVLMLIYVVPTLTDVFRELNVQLPLSTRIIIVLSDFLKNHFLIVAGMVVVVAVAISYVLKTVRGRQAYHNLLLHIPVISGITKETNSARTARTISSLLSAGVDFLIATRITEDVVQNVYYKEVLRKASLQIEKGKPISEVFLAEEWLYPAFVGEMASIGEETGKLGEMFKNVADFYENEVEQKTKDMSTIIEPFLMVIIGIGVGIFAISMLSPIYSLVDSI
ncbi:MAG: type II secretion system F family protein [Patescibacteria group bacterium]